MISININDVSGVNVRFRVPDQTLESLSFSGHSQKKLAAWVDALPRANLGETARLLYSGLQELNQLRIDAPLRFTLLEVMRPSVYYVCNALKKHYANQPIVLPDKASKVANLAQALQAHLANGYKIIVVQNVNKVEIADCKQQMSRAVHRAISDLTSTLDRCYQLYFPTPTHLWQEINGLYELADTHDFLEAELTDREAQFVSVCSIAHIYQRACILATAKMNQLRQNEIAHVYTLSAFLAQYIHISKKKGNAQTFVVDLRKGDEPIMRDLAHVSDGDQNRFFSCKPLVDQLQRMRSDDRGGSEGVQVAQGLTLELVQHLTQAWSGQKQRSFSRTQQTGGVELAVGMLMAHYHLAGECEFNDVLRGKAAGVRGDADGGSEEQGVKSSPLFQEASKDDVWSQAFGGSNDSLDMAGGKIGYTASSLNKLAEKKEKFKLCQSQLVNTSPGGYCVNLPQAMPGAIKTGELLGVREKGAARWGVGVIRWAKRISKENVRIGLELMASHANPVGVKLLRKTGVAGDFMRALLLPELKSLEQPMTILLPNIMFEEGSKVLLNQNGSEVKVQLLKQVVKTASFCQFTLNVLSPNKSLSGMELGSKDEDDFDTVWSSL